MWVFLMLVEHGLTIAHNTIMLITPPHMVTICTLYFKYRMLTTQIPKRKSSRNFCCIRLRRRGLYIFLFFGITVHSESKHFFAPTFDFFFLFCQPIKLLILNHAITFFTEIPTIMYTGWAAIAPRIICTAIFTLFFITDAILNVLFAILAMYRLSFIIILLCFHSPKLSKSSTHARQTMLCAVATFALHIKCIHGTLHRWGMSARSALIFISAVQR